METVSKAAGHCRKASSQYGALDHITDPQFSLVSLLFSLERNLSEDNVLSLSKFTSCWFPEHLASVGFPLHSFSCTAEFLVLNSNVQDLEPCAIQKWIWGVPNSKVTRSPILTWNSLLAESLGTCGINPMLFPWSLREVLQWLQTVEVPKV